MSACSPKEELEWRSRLADHSGRDTLDPGEQALFTSLSLPIKSMGTVFGKPGQFFFKLSALRIEDASPKTWTPTVNLAQAPSPEEYQFTEQLG
jgi:hypothetical protein